MDGKDTEETVKAAMNLGEKLLGLIPPNIEAIFIAIVAGVATYVIWRTFNG